MAENKTDRRSLKTQKALKAALAALLAEKELRHITVQEVSDKADVHRVTFYKHYYDIYDLYDQLENEVLSQLGLLLLEFHEKPTKDFGKELIDYIAENPVIFKMIFSPHNTGGLRQKFSTMVEGVFRLLQTEKNAVDYKDSHLDYISAFWSNGCVAVIEKWVLGDLAQPKAFILKTLSELDEHMESYVSKQFN
ncbi:MAG: TetR/AcrR family transcriptional regulator [Clostridia bacterium]|nr:TetR/AcrR family transcriptional regulator [Clostridia bacterium]